MTLNHKQSLLGELERWHPEYDPEARMVLKPFSTPGYHTTLKQVTHTHPTLAALVYALGLLDSEDTAYLQRAENILDKVISLQDQNKEHATYGIWSWFLEEPLTQMAPPDWNWADFCGKRLVLAEQRHGARLSAPLRERVREAVHCACEAIIKRDVGPGYTNIAIMGAFVTLIAGEVYGVERFAAYGLERLRKFAAYTRELGTFQEFNSPTYTVVAVQELSSIHTSTQLPEAKQLSGEMLDVAWRMIAEHYHVPTGQWSGPHSRSYSTVMTDAVRSFLLTAGVPSSSPSPSNRNDKAFTYNLDWYGNEIRCPERYFPYFQLAETKEYRQVMQKNAEGRPVNTATTYKDGFVSLGTFSKDVMWNQRRNLLAYVPAGDGFSYVHLRFLHDGYDYSSAVFTSVQERSDVLFGIGFCTNGGDTHIGLDPIDGTIEAADLRLRFELGGQVEGIKPQIGKEGEASDVSVSLGNGVNMQADVAFAAFDGETPHWSIVQDGEKLCLDYIVYEGARKTFDFRAMEQALLVLAFRLAEGPWTALEASASSAAGAAGGQEAGREAETGAGALPADTGAVPGERPQVYAEYRTPNGTVLALTLPLTPMEKQEMLR